MRDRLTFRATLVLAAIALGLAFAVGTLVGGGAPAAKPTAKRGPGLVARTPGPVVDLKLTAAATVPVLRASPQPRKRRVRPRKPARIVNRSVTTAPAPTPAQVVPAESVRPTPTAAPRQVAPAPPRVVPAPTPKPEPAPASTPETSGDFDTTGEP